MPAFSSFLQIGTTESKNALHCSCRQSAGLKATSYSGANDCESKVPTGFCESTVLKCICFDCVCMYVCKKVGQLQYAGQTAVKVCTHIYKSYTCVKCIN